MKYTFATLALAAGATALRIPRHTCSCKFNLTASGGVSGIVGQLDDGQNRVGGSHPADSYCMDDGQMTDSHGRGCILTPPSSQFQCDVGPLLLETFPLATMEQLYKTNRPLSTHALPPTLNTTSTPPLSQAKSNV